jgi:phosphoribosyl 1,2-cyclic phosphodiesterase
MPFKVIHHVPCYGFVFEEAGARVLHFNDSGPELSGIHHHLMEGVDVAIFHTPTFEPYRSHISVQEIMSLVQDYSIQRVIITHINHNNFLHEELVEKVAPQGITVAYDGLTLEV